MKPLIPGSHASTILRSLQNGITLTPAIAAKYQNCYCLSQRIGELSRRGHIISVEYIEKFAHYFMTKEQTAYSRRIERGDY
jgi:hypothetical protein